MLAAASATGVRSWLQNTHLAWLTPARLRRVTIAVCVVATLVSTVGLSGSSTSTHPTGAPAATAHR